MKNLTPLQWLGIVIGAASFLAGATANLTTLFGTTGAALIAAACSLAAGIAGVVVTVISGQSSQIRNVAAIQGDDGRPAVRIAVNANAPASLASAAIDPAQANIGASSPEARSTLIATAKGG